MWKLILKTLITFFSPFSLFLLMSNWKVQFHPVCLNKCLIVLFIRAYSCILPMLCRVNYSKAFHANSLKSSIFISNKTTDCFGGGECALNCSNMSSFNYRGSAYPHSCFDMTGGRFTSLTDTLERTKGHHIFFFCARFWTAVFPKLC